MRHKTGVGGLVIVHRMRVRHEQRAHAGGGELGDGERAGAAHHHIGIAVSRHHIVDKFHTFGLHAQLIVSRLQIAQLVAPGLVVNLRAHFFGQ